MESLTNGDWVVRLLIEGAHSRTGLTAPTAPLTASIVDYVPTLNEGEAADADFRRVGMSYSPSIGPLYDRVSRVSSMLLSSAPLLSDVENVVIAIDSLSASLPALALLALS